MFHLALMTATAMAGLIGSGLTYLELRHATGLKRRLLQGAVACGGVLSIANCWMLVSEFLIQ